MTAPRTPGRLPQHQPARAAVVLCGFLLAVAAASAVAATVFDGPLVVLVTVGLAALLGVLAAVLLTVVPADTLTVDAPTLPVLVRRPPGAQRPPDEAQRAADPPR